MIELLREIVGLQVGDLVRLKFSTCCELAAEFAPHVGTLLPSDIPASVQNFMTMRFRITAITTPTTAYVRILNSPWKMDIGRRTAFYHKELELVKDF